MKRIYIILCVFAATALAQDTPKRALPKVVLLGDSVREHYAPLFLVPCAVLVGAESPAKTVLKTETFDRDPGWEGVNNRATTPEPRTIQQDFGFSPTSHAGGSAGEMGARITAAGEPAFYAKKIAAKSFRDTLTASGTMACASQPFNALLGFFNAETLNEWRTPNTIALRINGRGDGFHAYLEYATGKWRAGGGAFNVTDPATGGKTLRVFTDKEAIHRWSLKYEPGGDGGGNITATIDDQTVSAHVDAAVASDGAAFNRFGLLNVLKSAGDGGELWVDDVTVNGELENFARDPGWDQFQNRRSYVTRDVRPRFDFGFSPTHFAGGKAAGELGGLVFRGDCRQAARMACYGDRIGALDLEQPLKASGKMSLRRGVTDSTTLIGFYHSSDSMALNPSQSSATPGSFLGVAIEGPSSEGFLLYPICRANGDEMAKAAGADRPHIHPDGSSHDWSVEYSPDGTGKITVPLDRQSVAIVLDAKIKARGARFDRFGLITTWIDGNGQNVFFDDLTYTAGRPPTSP